MTTTTLIPQLSILCMGISAVLCTVLPLIALFAFKNRFHVRIQSFFMGSITYVIFALVLKSFANEFFLSGTSGISQSILENPYIYALYAAVAAAIFEEAGRFFCLSWLMKYARKEDAVVYGMGHGIIEAVLGGSWMMIQDVVISIALNRIGDVATYAAQAPTPEEAESITAYLTNLMTVPGSAHLLISVERMVFFILQVSLSVLMYKAITRKKRAYIPLVVLLHILVSFISALYQTGAVASLGMVVLLLVVCGLGAALFSYRQYQSLKYEEY